METQEFKTVNQDDGVDLFDIFFDFSILFIVFGVVVFILAFFGAIGALRENVCLLKTVSKGSGLVLSLQDNIRKAWICSINLRWDRVSEPPVEIG